MSGVANWHEMNTRYLASAVAWVRELLEERADRAQQLPLPPLEPPERRHLPWFHWLRRVPRHSPAPPDPLLASDNRRHSRRGDLAAAAPLDTAGTTPALATLRDRLGLTRFEVNILVLCTAMELDTSIAGLCARAQGDPERRYPTFALALALFEEPAWESLSPERPLRHWHLVEINQPGGQPLTVSRLRADEWIVNYLKGLTYLDDRLTPLLSPLALSEVTETAPPSQQRAAETILSGLRQIPDGGALPIVQMLGADRASKHLVAGIVCRSLRVGPYRLQWGLLPTAPADLETFARLWQRASLLLPLALYLDAEGADASHSAQAPAINRFLARLNALVLVDTREPWPGLSQNVITVDVAKPTPAEQKAAWAAALGPDAGTSPSLLAGQFSLNLAAIAEIAAEARVGAEPGPIDAARLWNVCLTRTRPRLDTMAERIDPKATWDDIVLPAAEKALLRQIADQVAQRSTVYQDWGFDRKMSRGFGISALFAGESGTGKTMAAEVIANHLSLNLYRVDLSGVISKYIGETEKNLRGMFDAAEDGGAILFFDEADALFGKRSEVKDSHDRYANIEVNYLLQRMESYGGLAILATNMKSALDAAFLRRLRFVVNFPFPGFAERKAIWERAFPPETPTLALDFDRLARLNITGGHIALIALNAAFVAAEAGGKVTMPLVLDAARTEYRKLERSIHEPDFRWPASPVRVA